MSHNGLAVKRLMIKHPYMIWDHFQLEDCWEGTDNEGREDCYESTVRKTWVSDAEELSKCTLS